MIGILRGIQYAMMFNCVMFGVPNLYQVQGLESLYRHTGVMLTLSGMGVVAMLTQQTADKLIEKQKERRE